MSNYFQIDAAAICEMADDDLEKLFPKHGDRIHIRSFCNKFIKFKKQSLIEKLKLKMNEGKKRKEDSPQNHLRKKKATRVITLGWLHFSIKYNDYRQVKTKCGGGTRKISVPKYFRCTDILEAAKELFFPKGVSNKGKIELFVTELLDYKNHECDQDLTVDDMYNITGLTTLRFYLATRYKSGVNITNSNDDDMFIPQSSTSMSRNENIEDPENSDTDIMPTRRSVRLATQNLLLTTIQNVNETKPLQTEESAVPAESHNLLEDGSSSVVFELLDVLDNDRVRLLHLRYFKYSKHVIKTQNPFC